MQLSEPFAIFIVTILLDATKLRMSYESGLSKALGQSNWHHDTQLNDNHNNDTKHKTPSKMILTSNTERNSNQIGNHHSETLYSDIVFNLKKIVRSYGNVDAAL